MIREKTKSEIVIDLTGPEGNAYVLLGYAQSFARQLGMSAIEEQRLITDMKSGDYEHLLEVFDSAFGEFVILER